MAWDSNAGRDAEVFLVWLRAAELQLPNRERASVHWLVERFERQQREADAALERRLSRDFATAKDGYRASVDVSRGRMSTPACEPPSR